MGLHVELQERHLVPKPSPFHLNATTLRTPWPAIGQGPVQLCIGVVRRQRRLQGVAAVVRCILRSVLEVDVPRHLPVNGKPSEANSGVFFSSSTPRVCTIRRMSPHAMFSVAALLRYARTKCSIRPLISCPASSKDHVPELVFGTGDFCKVHYCRLE